GTPRQGPRAGRGRGRRHAGPYRTPPDHSRAHLPPGNRGPERPMTDGTQASNRPLNPRRIGVIAFHTFTQLVRMKVFYFLAFFALILLGSNLFDIQGLGRPE